LLTSGNSTLSEYPDVKQISLGPRWAFKEQKNAAEMFDFKRFATIYEKNLKLYNHSFETYKKVAKDYNIDLFFCDVMVNDACLDVAHATKKPVVGFSSFLNGNCKYINMHAYPFSNYYYSFFSRLCSNSSCDV
jgi:hypothetical protein